MRLTIRAAWDCYRWNVLRRAAPPEVRIMREELVTGGRDEGRA